MIEQIPSPVPPQPALPQQAQQQTFGDLDERTFLTKLNKLQTIAPALGYDPNEVNDFVRAQRVQYLSAKGVPFKEIEKDPYILGAQASEVAASGYKPKAEEKTEVAQAILEQIKGNTAPNFNDIPAEYQGEVSRILKEEGTTLGELSRQKEGAVVAKTVKDLRDAYLGDNLNRGPVGGGAATLLAKFGLADKTSNYNELRETSVLGLKDLFNTSKGRSTLTPEVLSRLEGLLPEVTDTPGEMEGNWERLRDLVKTKYDIDIGEYQEKPGGGTGILSDDEILKAIQ